MYRICIITFGLVKCDCLDIDTSYFIIHIYILTVLLGECFWWVEWGAGVDKLLILCLYLKNNLNISLNTC